MIIHLLRVKVFPKDRGNAVKTIRSIIGITKAKVGCLTSSLYSQTENDDELLLIEKWGSREALESHIRSEQYDNVLAVMELAIEQPLIEFHEENLDVQGLKFIETIRLSNTLINT